MNILFILQGTGMPNTLAEGGCRIKVAPEHLPGPTEAADQYDAEKRSHLTRVSTFGTNPFETPQEQQNTEMAFSSRCPDLGNLLC